MTSNFVDYVKILVRSGKGPFISHLTPLSPGTAYYYRAYATNATGTVYGEERTLLTN